MTHPVETKVISLKGEGVENRRFIIQKQSAIRIASNFLLMAFVFGENYYGVYFQNAINLSEGFLIASNCLHCLNFVNFYLSKSQQIQVKTTFKTSIKSFCVVTEKD